MEKNGSIPILIPLEPEEFWIKIRTIIKEELKNSKSQEQCSISMSTPGLTEKPLYKIQEICILFNVTRTTIYDWVKHGKLKRIKIRSRVFFLGSNVRELLHS